MTTASNPAALKQIVVTRKSKRGFIASATAGGDPARHGHIETLTPSLRGAEAREFYRQQRLAKKGSAQ